jgi:hypothetical protein
VETPNLNIKPNGCFASPDQRGIIRNILTSPWSYAMARRKQTSKSSSKRRLSVSQIVLYIISLLIVLSMAIGFVVSVLPTPGRNQPAFTPTPTFFFATITPTPTQEPTATPTPATETPSADSAATPQSGQ